MPSPSHHPHDRFFRAAFSQLPVVKDFLRNFVPQELIQNLKLDSLTQVEASYLDKRLKEHLSDVVYDCQYGEEQVTITLLFEHKSYLTNLPWLQLLRYLLNAYDSQRRNHPKAKSLNPVIPIVVYHGEKGWEVKPIHQDFIGIDHRLRPFIPEFSYLLTDLSEYSESQLMEMESNWVKHAFLALKLSRRQGLFNRLAFILQGMSMNPENEPIANFIDLIIVYLFQASDLEDKLLEKIESLDVPLKEKVMTIYDSIYDDAIKKGLKTGIDKGIEQGRELGIELGRELGRKLGRELGREEGRIEGEVNGLKKGELRKSFQVFNNGLTRGILLEDLIAITGISRKQALQWKKHIEAGGTVEDLFNFIR